jgi:ADP-ribose pyrophosphatase YjhB (NUDIX family)
MLIVRKATAFITRETANGREVLVFRHPEAGIQLPAGTVEDGESFEDGALREACEETGMCDLALVKHLGTLEQCFDGMQRRVICDVELLEAPNGTSNGIMLERGNRVLLHEARHGYAYITHDAVNDPYYPYPSVSGWLHADAVQRHHLVRHLFHLATTAPVPDAWKHLVEGKYLFRFFWVNVKDYPHLVEPQQLWWDAVIEQLR